MLTPSFISMTKLLLSLYTLIWPLGSLLIAPKLFSLPIYYLDLLHLSFTLTLIKTRLYFIKDRSVIFLLLTLWLSLAFSTKLAQPRDYLISVSYLLRLIAVIGFYFSLNSISITLRRRLLFFMLTSFMFLGLAQYLFFPDIRLYQYLGFDDHYYRLVGSLLDPNYTGAVLTVAFFVFATLPLRLSWSLQLLSLLTLLLTFSRASFLSFFIILCLKLAKQHRLKYLLLFIPAVILGVYFLPKPFGEGVNLLRTYSVYSRLSANLDALEIFKAHPLFGVGFNTLKLSFPGSHSTGIDNSYLYILATSGLAGISAFIYFLYTQLKPIRHHPYFLALLSLLIHSLFNNTFFYIWITSLFFLILSLAKADISPSTPSPPDSPPDHSPQP